MPGRKPGYRLRTAVNARKYRHSGGPLSHIQTLTEISTSDSEIEVLESPLEHPEVVEPAELQEESWRGGVSHEVETDFEGGRWTDLSSEADEEETLAARDAQFHVQAFSSRKYASHRRIPGPEHVAGRLD
jgi:hypothetical protein